ncbi:MAG TPA: hypothetical protein VF855_06615, partial [Acidimicrobiales bacterium]
MSVSHAAITRFAEPRGNMVTKRQLREELGLPNRTMSRYVQESFLVPLTHDVFGVALAKPTALHYMRAACLTWPDVVIGDSTAAGIWGLRRARRDSFELLVPTGRKVHVPHAHIRRSNRLTEEDIVEHLDGLRATTPARTLFDQAAVLDPFALRSMAEDALNKELCTMAGLREVAGRLAGRGRGGTDLFRRYLDDRPDDQAPVMSELELRLADALRSAGIPVEQQRKVVLPTGRVVFLDLAI